MVKISTFKNYGVLLGKPEAKQSGLHPRMLLTNISLYLGLSNIAALNYVCVAATKGGYLK